MSPSAEEIIIEVLLNSTLSEGARAAGARGVCKPRIKSLGAPSSLVVEVGGGAFFTFFGGLICEMFFVHLLLQTWTGGMLATSARISNGSFGPPRITELLHPMAATGLCLHWIG